MRQRRRVIIVIGALVAAFALATCMRHCRRLMDERQANQEEALILDHDRALADRTAA